MYLWVDELKYNVKAKWLKFNTFQLIFSLALYAQVLSNF